MAMLPMRIGDVALFHDGRDTVAGNEQRPATQQLRVSPLENPALSDESGSL